MQRQELKQKQIAVLMGGLSAERDVSLRTGRAIGQALQRCGYQIVEIDAGRDLPAQLERAGAEVVFIALHGRFGEDGTVQEVLEFLGLPYTGPGVTASALAWDKAISKRLFRDAGVPTPAWCTFTSDAVKQMGAAAALDLVPGALGGFPVVVKPARQGSALGLTRVEVPEELAGALLNALSYDEKAIVETLSLIHI